MNTREEILQKLAELKPQVQARYKATQIGLFGSFIRREQDQASDVDLLVDFEEGADLFDFVGLASFLEEQLQRKVDLVTRRALRPELREQILEQVEMV